MLRRLTAALFVVLILIQPALAADDDIARLHTFSAGQIIQSSQINGEYNQIITTLNGKMSRAGTNTVSGDNTFSGDNTHSGDNTFSGTNSFTHSTTPIKTDKIGEYTSAAGVTIDSVVLKDGMATVSGTPTTAGQIGYASNVLQYHNGTSVVDVGQAISAIYSISTGTQAGTASGALYVCTSTFTLTFQAASSNGAKWVAHIRNDGTGIITIDPDGTETIDGKTTIKAFPGESFSVVCDGSNFKTIGRKLGPVLITSGTASNVSTVDITTGIDSSFDHYMLKVWDLVPATNDTNLSMRVTTNGGSSWASGSSDYTWQAQSGTGWVSTGSLGDSSLGLNYQGSSDGKLSNSANATCNFDLTFNNPSGTARYKTFNAIGSIYNSSGRGSSLNAGGAYIGSTSAINGLRFFMSSGNISMNYALYGWRKS